MARGDSGAGSPSIPSATAGSPAGAGHGRASRPWHKGLLATAAWPDPPPRDEAAERDMAVVQGVVRMLRDLRATINQQRSAAAQPTLRTLPSAVVRAGAAVAGVLQASGETLRLLGAVEALEVGPAVAKPPECASAADVGLEVYIPTTGLIDRSAVRRRLEAEIAKVAADVERRRKKLANTNYTSRAPAEVVQRDRDRLAEAEEVLAALQGDLAGMV